jgi:hypothetical protein
VGVPGCRVIESLTTANDGAPGINGEQAPTGAGTSSLVGFLRAYDVTHLDEDGTYGHWCTLPWTRSEKLLVVRDRWELG